GLFLVLALSACATKPFPNEPPLPDWLTAIIDSLEHPPVSNPPAFIARYDYRGQTVYYVAPRCCDIRGVLYDSTGTVLCAPDGGIDGRGDGRCPDFLAERKEE